MMGQAVLRLVGKEDGDKQKALEAAIAQIDRAFGKGSVMKLGKGGKVGEIESVSTGSLGLDLALGIGGLPRGRVIEVFGLEPDGPILDWGCGSGRTLHWLHAHPAWRDAWRGCDVDAKAIRWLKSKGFDAQAEVCPDLPPLPYPDAAFAGLYSFSVLTHIHPERHRAWYGELARILRPGARAHLTVQGDGPVLAEGKGYHGVELDLLRRQGWLWAERPGHHKNAAVVGEAFTRSALDGLFEIERYSPGGYARLDEIIVRKP